MLECLAVIPARGGSKGVKRKNVHSVGGKPLIVHAIEAATNAKHITRVVVSTDDAEIARVARGAGAEVVDRPQALSGDTASSEGAVLHCLETLQRDNYQPELVALVQCTSPLMYGEDLDGAVEKLLAFEADCCFTASFFHGFIWSENRNGETKGVNHTGTKRQRRQDRPTQYLENGAAYVMKTAEFIRAEDRFCGKVVAYSMPQERSFEIDTPEDLEIVEAVMQLRRPEPKTRFPDPLEAVVFDFDGVFTDNAVLVLEDGREAVRCDRGDGLGLEILRDSGIAVLILSKERNPVVSARARKLNLPCIQATDDKPTVLKSWLREHSIDPQRTIFVGNDINDIGCMQMVGCGVCPADSHHTVLSIADVILTKSGGRGAVRELCDQVLPLLQKGN